MEEALQNGVKGRVFGSEGAAELEGPGKRVVEGGGPGQVRPAESSGKASKGGGRSRCTAE